MSMENQAKQMKIVYTVVERGAGKSFWVRIGAAFVNSDGSINIKLDAIPTNGSLQLRDWEPAAERREPSARPALRARGEADVRDVIAPI